MTNPAGRDRDGAGTTAGARLQRVLGSHIGGPFHDDDGRGGLGRWWIFLEVEVQLAERVVARPDLAGWRRERLPDAWVFGRTQWFPIGAAGGRSLESSNASLERLPRGFAERRQLEDVQYSLRLAIVATRRVQDLDAPRCDPRQVGWRPAFIIDRARSMCSSADS